MMADGKELKPRSFRIDDETAERIKEYQTQLAVISRKRLQN